MSAVANLYNLQLYYRERTQRWLYRPPLALPDGFTDPSTNTRKARACGMPVRNSDSAALAEAYGTVRKSIISGRRAKRTQSARKQRAARAS